jgi:hypothetical protein
MKQTSGTALNQMPKTTNSPSHQVNQPIRRPNTVLISAGLFLFAVFVNVGFGLAVSYSKNYADLEADEAEYVRLANQLINGSLALDGRRTLGFPLMLSLLMRIAPNIGWLQIAVSVIYSFTIPLFYVALLRFNRTWIVCFVAAMLLMLWPPALMYGNSLYSESAAMPFLALLLLTLPIVRKDATPAFEGQMGTYLVAGILIGVLTHLRPMYLLIIPFVFLTIVVETKKFRLSVLYMIAIAAGFLVIILPWSIYISQVIHTPVLATASAGETMAGGLNPNLEALEGAANIQLADRNTWVGPGKWVEASSTGFVTAEETNLPYAQLSKLLNERCLDWIKTNPGTAAYLEFRKLSYMWGIYPNLANGTKQFLVGNIPIVLLLAWTVYCITQTPALAVRLVRFLVLPIFVSSVALISWGSWRFRLPGDFGLIAFSVLSTSKLLEGRIFRS